MTIKIGKKIKGYSVIKANDKAATEEKAAVTAPAPAQKIEAKGEDFSSFGSADVIQMHERLERPEMLVGSTYKIKSPLVEHALYVTINDIVLNPGTEHESRRPFEVFINSKNMDHFQWVVAITRIMSAVFRKGGDVTFLVEELKAVFDPRGGYFKAGGVYMPSIVAEIGAAIEDHLKMIGMIVDEDLSPEQKRLIAEKRAAFENRAKKSPGAGRKSAAKLLAGSAEERHEKNTSFTESNVNSYPPGATMCNKCNTQAVVIMDGCATCLSCGYSKCG